MTSASSSLQQNYPGMDECSPRSSTSEYMGDLAGVEDKKQAAATTTASVESGITGSSSTITKGSAFFHHKKHHRFLSFRKPPPPPLPEDEENKKNVMMAADSMHRHTSILFCFRLTVFAMLVGFLVHFILSSSEEKEFQNAFDQHARTIANLADTKARKEIFGGLEALATSVTSLALEEEEEERNSSSNSTSSSRFPNMMIPHFDIRAQRLADLSGIAMVLWIPLVPQEERSSWTAFSQQSIPMSLQQDYTYRNWDMEWNVSGSIPQEIHTPDDDITHFRKLRTEMIMDDTRLGAENNYRHLRGREFGQGYSFRAHEDLNEANTQEQLVHAVLTNAGYAAALDNFSAPIAQAGPALSDPSLLLADLFRDSNIQAAMARSIDTDLPIFSEPVDLGWFLKHLNGTTIQDTENIGESSLWSFTLDPVKEDFRPGSRTAGFIMSVLPWNAILGYILPPGVNGIMITVQDDCFRSTYSYVASWNGEMTTGLRGDHHDSRYDFMAHRSDTYWGQRTSSSESIPRDAQHHQYCEATISIYPMAEFEEQYKSDKPLVVAGFVVVAIIAVGILAWVWINIRAKEKQRLQDKADRARAIVTSVFPQAIGDRLIQEADEAAENKKPRKAQNSLQQFLRDGKTEVKSKPIADLFLETTVLFADIVGFTAWSSARDPADVFRLLETLYGEFDKLSQKRGVYKVETVGDCYVAVAGLPDPRKDHFIAAGRLAGDIVIRMGVITKQLETELGPDTADLGIRVGLHSGPVTAGVLRGDRARFQLFGDTMNTTARIESTGAKNRIHISKETAERLVEAGKGHWVTPREDQVEAKGKGKLTTFWLDTNISLHGLSNMTDSSNGGITEVTSENSHFSLSGSHREKSRKQKPRGTTDMKLQRLIQWNVDILAGLLSRIEDQRKANQVIPDTPESLKQLEDTVRSRQGNTTPMAEVAEAIAMPYCGEKRVEQCEAEISSTVISQLREYVSTIALMYNSNAFHNFQHASHVTMSVMKLLGRIDTQGESEYTSGLATDPLMHFSVILSALLHDVDHPGVPNSQLVKEGKDAAKLYRNKCIAEQKSIDLAWDLLMEEQYQELRSAIYVTRSELKRFRQIVVNLIVATDVMDPWLRQHRNRRWKVTFADTTSRDKKDAQRQAERKAMIVLEHLIQASDVAHTMQHWQVYRKWNAKLFAEMYNAYQSGRADKDPSLTWYEGEIGFFDHYVIPLAKKLEECGVFGVSSDEYLYYAIQNRNEWKAKGRQIVEELKKAEPSL